MTDAEIYGAFTAAEREANQTPQGVDHQAVYARLAEQSGRSLSEVKEIILDNTFMGPN